MKQHSPIGIYAQLIHFFISELEHGIVPWHRPWTQNGMPMNLISAMPYAGINTLYLASLGYAENFFLTYGEIKAIKASVKDDEKGYPVILSEHNVRTEDGKGLKMINQAIVFNIAQCNDIPREMVPPIEWPSNPSDMCYELVHNMPNKPVIRHQGDRAYYRADLDLVLMPLMKSFNGDLENYHAALMRELIHASGHQKRLNRKEVVEDCDPDLKELTAEIGLWHFLSWNGMTVSHHATEAYRERWVAKFKENHLLLFEACLQ